MAKMTKWRSYHVKITTLEDIMGVRLSSFRNMFRGDFDAEDISIRLPRERWEHYGVKDALESLGFGNVGVVYINI